MFTTKRTQIIMPTGTGKTLVQAEIVREFLSRNTGHKIIVVLNHRILLSYQLLIEYMKHLMSNGVDARYLNLNSGNFPEHIATEMARKEGLDPSAVPSTTSQLTVDMSIREAQRDNRPIIICGTYDSSDKVICKKVDLQINDEAHFLTHDDNFHAIRDTQAEHILSFTATPRGADDQGRGMGNAAVYGPVCYTASPKEMIEAGEMVKPAIHLVGSADTDYHDDSSSVVLGIINAFNEHEKALRDGEYSGTKNDIGGKVLITFTERTELYDIYASSNNFSDFEQQGIKVFALASNDDNVGPFGVYYDGVTSKRAGNAEKYQLLKSIRELGDKDRCIIMHIDMLSEGIDVPNMTAIMPFRNMDKGKFMQNLGRALRLHKEDRNRIYEGGDPSDRLSYIKPYGWIIIPKFISRSYDFLSRYEKILTDLCHNYGFDANSGTILETPKGIKEIDDAQVINQDEYKSKLTEAWAREFIHKMECPDAESYYHLDMALQDLYLLLTQEQFKTWWEKYMRDQIGLYPPSHRLITASDIKLLANRKKHLAEEYENGYDISENETYNLMEKKARKHKWGNFREEVKKRYGAVYTPEFVVNKTIDLIWDKTPDKLNKKYIDPACGDGNFLIELYKRLMQEPSNIPETHKSEHILTNCLYGVEILRNMHYACKIRLFIKHCELCKEHNKDIDPTIFERMNIVHGDTILTEEDPQPTDPQQGGLVPDRIENQKFDIIVGNPPYTHMRNVEKAGGVDYKRYAPQRDMAQKFVRWALDHMSEDGYCGYNTTDSWIEKLTDGSKYTRQRIDHKILAIIDNEEVKRYSEGSGGDINTIILAFSNTKSDRKLTYNGHKFTYNQEDITKRPFLRIFRNHNTKYPFVDTHIDLPLKAGRSTNPFGTKTEFWKSFIYKSYGSNKHYIASKRRITSKDSSQYPGTWKLISTDVDFKDLLDEFEGEIKNIEVDRDLGLWLLGYLNTQTCYKYLQTFTRTRMAGNYELSNNSWQFIRIPHLNHYKENKPKQFSEYMKWIENNMNNKNTFIAEIDQQFQKLIKE